MSTDNTPYSHDKSYKRLFSSPELVQQLVEGFVDPAIARLLDFATLERVEGSYITPTMKNRENDIVWKVQAGNTTVYLYLLLEFQSTVDHAMPVRMMLYIAALYEQLIKTNPQAGLPPVLPIVLYNGDNKWTAKTSIQDLMPSYPEALAPYQLQCNYLLIDENSYAQHELESVRNFVAGVFAIETAKTQVDFINAIHHLQRLAKENNELSVVIQTIEAWLSMKLHHKFPDIQVDDINLCEETGMLETNIDRWYDQAYSSGVQQGISQGISQGKIVMLKGILSMRFPNADLTCYQRSIESAVEDELMRYTIKAATAASIEEVFS